MLAIDKEICFQSIESPVDALCILFASFYVFNIQYAGKAHATMEFMQR